MLRVVAFSDTHGRYDGLTPPADILINSGDFTNLNAKADWLHFSKWLKRYPARHKLVTYGNHEYFTPRKPRSQSAAASSSRMTQLPIEGTLLLGKSLKVDGLTIFAHPFTETFGCNRKDDGIQAERWVAKMPTRVDILVTHVPPAGILDMAAHGESCGSRRLRELVDKYKPRLHIFGHVHHQGAKVESNNHTVFVNAANSIVEIDISKTVVSIVNRYKRGALLGGLFPRSFRDCSLSDLTDTDWDRYVKRFKMPTKSPLKKLL